MEISVKFKVLPLPYFKFQEALLQRTTSLAASKNGVVIFFDKCSHMLLRNYNYVSVLLIDGNSFVIETVFQLYFYESTLDKEYIT